MKRILLVEDNRLTQELVQDMLTEYRLQIVASGVEALHLCRESPPDLLIVDLNLITPPDSTEKKLSGLDLLRQLSVAIPFIVLTADRSSDTRRAAIKAGALAYYLKPPDPDNLVSTVEVALALAAERKHWEQQAKIQYAIGILMALYKMDENQARQALRALAAAERRKMDEIAQQIVTAQTMLNRLAGWNSEVNG